jgi:hypothetical protein
MEGRGGGGGGERHVCDSHCYKLNKPHKNMFFPLCAFLSTVCIGVGSGDYR